MSAQALQSPLPTFTGLDGQPLSGGYIYVGTANQDPEQYPLAVYWDEAMTQEATQPLRTTAGYISRNGAPASVWVSASCSIRGRDSQNRQVFYVAEWDTPALGLAAELTLALADIAAQEATSVAAVEAAQATAEAAVDALVTQAETAETNAETAASLAQLLIATVRFATKLLMEADLAHAAGTFAAVYADGTSTNNGIYYKLGASGAGSWARYTGGSWTLDLLEVLTSITFAGMITRKATNIAGYRFALPDATGYVPFGIRNDGWVDVKLHRTSLPDFTYRLGGGRFSAQMNMIINAGQSLAVGPAGAITTSQEYDNLKWVALTSTFEAATQNTGEPPSMGTTGHLKELLVEEDGITYTTNDFRLVTYDGGVSAQTIVQLSPGGSSGAYELSITAVTDAKAKADAMGLTFAVPAVTWTQGEADAGIAEATYKAALIALAETYNTDIKAITGQTFDVAFITYQTCSTVNKSVAVAQWKAAQEHPLIYMAGPIYHAAYGDFQHIDAASSKYILGGMYGKVIKRVCIDRVGWEPLQPASVQVLGNNIDIIFNREALNINDTSFMPAQTNSGFTVLNGASVSQTINSVSIMSGKRIRLAMASTPASGWKVQYGHNSVTGKSPFIGGGGNLRDSEGDSDVYGGVDQHNPCVIFDWEL